MLTHTADNAERESDLVLSNDMIIHLSMHDLCRNVDIRISL